MSVEAMAIVLHHSRAKGTAKLIMLGIANHDGDGGAWPTVRKLAKYGACSRSQVQRALTQLEQLGEVRRFVQAGGDHRFAPHERPNRYQVLLRCPHDCDRSTNHRTPADSAIEIDLDPEQVADVDVLDPVAPTRPLTPSHSRGPVAPAQPTPAAHMRPKPSTQPTTHLSETNPSNRARVKAPIWSSDRCPADWKNGRHALSASGKCGHCHEKPTAYVNRSTGEIR